jgi:hypothetical protein
LSFGVLSMTTVKSVAPAFRRNVGAVDEEGVDSQEKQKMVSSRPGG